MCRVKEMKEKRESKREERERGKSEREREPSYVHSKERGQFQVFHLRGKRENSLTRKRKEKLFLPCFAAAEIRNKKEEETPRKTTPSEAFILRKKK